MREFQGRVAAVTGAASGIGLGVARALARRGVNVALLDIEAGPLEAAAAELRGLGVDAWPVVVDVADRDAMYDAAGAIDARFGRLDILVNNAGVAYNAKPLHEMPDEAYDWSMSVNLFGVIHGIKAFVPLIVRGGTGGHVVNTASIGGFQVRKSEMWHQGLYAATKYAVVALSEGLRQDLERYGIGVTVFAPSSVDTNIATSDRNRQAQFGGPGEGSQNPVVAEMLKKGIRPDLAGERVVHAIVHDELYAFTNPADRPLLEARHKAILDSYVELQRFLEMHGAAATEPAR